MNCLSKTNYYYNFKLAFLFWQIQDLTKMAQAIVLENIRSAYNVGNLVRAADAFGFDVIISGYTPSPLKEPRVLKTSLGAEKHVKIYQFWNPAAAIDFARQNYKTLIGAETVPQAVALNEFEFPSEFAIFFGNEVDGILPQTLEQMDVLVQIPMQGFKTSLNVGQA